MWKTTEELYQLMTDMPMFSAHFLSTIIQLLQAYCEECQAMFRGQWSGDVLEMLSILFTMCCLNTLLLLFPFIASKALKYVQIVVFQT